MPLKYVYGVTVGVVAFGMVTVGPAYAQRRDGNLLPQENSGQVDRGGMFGSWRCRARRKEGQVRIGAPGKGPVASVPEASCTADPGADALTIDNPEKGKITDAALGRWVEISGRLESETNKNPDNLRELDVETFKLVPVVIPPKPTPQPAPAPVAEAPRPARTGRGRPDACSRRARACKTLPKTASPMPAIGLAGLLSLAAGLMLRSFRLRQRE